MSNTQTNTLPVQNVVDRKALGEALDRYLQSVKEIRKRGGELEAFQSEKLANAINFALMACGINDAGVAKRITSRVVFRIQQKFNGHAIPTTREVREIVGVCFIDHNLPHAAKVYLTHDKLRDRTAPSPRYGLGISVQRKFTRTGVDPFDLITWEKRD